MRPAGGGALTGVASLGEGNGDHECVVRLDATVWCWGWDEAGQLGDGSTVLQRTHPVRVKQGKGFLAGIQSIAVGVVHTCALTKAGVAWCWGSNYDGGVGDGSQRTAPHQAGQGEVLALRTG